MVVSCPVSARRQESDSESEEERRRPGPSEVTLGSSDEDQETVGSACQNGHVVL